MQLVEQKEFQLNIGSELRTTKIDKYVTRTQLSRLNVFRAQGNRVGIRSGRSNHMYAPPIKAFK